jgi:ribose 5-phosphate isomerase B
MTIIIGADHRGFSLKEQLKSTLLFQGIHLIDCGPESFNPDDDYCDIAQKAAELLKDNDNRAVLICGSGHGMDITANRFPFIRAILGFNPDVVKQGRQHEDANVLVIPADWITPENAETMVQLFLNTPASDEPRHQRRRQKLALL